MLRRSSLPWLLVLAVAGCGGSKADRFDLKTPNVHTGVGPVVTLAAPTPVPTVKATPTPTPVTKDEKRVIQGWADELRHGHVAAASRYFAVPAKVQNATLAETLKTREQVRDFNTTLPCGAKLLTTRRAEAHVVIGTFQLTERPGPGGSCGTGTGNLAAVAFVVKHHHISQWLRRDEAVDPTATPGP